MFVLREQPLQCLVPACKRKVSSFDCRGLLCNKKKYIIPPIGPCINFTIALHDLIS